MNTQIETGTEEKTEEKKFKVVFIGEKRLETKILPYSEACGLFEKLGYEFWQARRGMIPAFVVTEI